MKDKSVTKVAEDEFEKEPNDVYFNRFELSECLRMNLILLIKSVL